MATPSSDTLCILCNEDISGSEVRTQEGQHVHKECRKRWGVKYYIQAAKSKEQIDTPSPCRLRSQNKKFEISQDCIFCCQPAQCDGRQRGYDVFPVKTAAFEMSIRQVWEERKDDWSQDVLGRLSYASDLCVQKTVYHQQCSVNFRTERDKRCWDWQKAKTWEFSSRFTRKIRGFRTCRKNCEENSDEQITVIELTKKMEEYLEQTGSKQKAYGVQYMKKLSLRNILVTG